LLFHLCLIRKSKGGLTKVPLFLLAFQKNGLAGG
jgi:hypothetical protein